MSGDITVEDICIFEAIDYKETMGSRGQQLNLRECPSCGKDSWKVYINAETSLGNCFSCGQTFNLFSFARAMLRGRGGVGLDNRQVGLYLNDVRKKLGYRPKEKVSTTPVIKVVDDLVLPTSSALPYEDGWNHPYLETRGIDGYYAAQFHLRYSNFGVHVYKDDKGETIRQNFAERIIIPVHDIDGKLVTFQGRDVTGSAEKKYKFAAGLPGTARYLYRGHVAKALKSVHVVMGEGAFDVVGIQKAIDSTPSMAGDTAIGSWGKHLSKSNDGQDQVLGFLQLKKVGLELVTIMYDPEPKAYEEALAAASILLKIGLRPFIAMLPAGQDPGDADASVIARSIAEAPEYTRISALKLRMSNPYRNRLH